MVSTFVHALSALTLILSTLVHGNQFDSQGVHHDDPFDWVITHVFGDTFFKGITWGSALFETPEEACHAASYQDPFVLITACYDGESLRIGCAQKDDRGRFTGKKEVRLMKCPNDLRCHYSVDNTTHRGKCQ